MWPFAFTATTSEVGSVKKRKKGSGSKPDRPNGRNCEAPYKAKRALGCTESHRPSCGEEVEAGGQPAAANVCQLTEEGGRGEGWWSVWADGACSHRLWMRRWWWLLVKGWRVSGAVKANKRTHRGACRSGRPVFGLQAGVRSQGGFGWARGPASDAPVVHDGALDRAECSVSSGWRLTLNKLKMLWILASDYPSACDGDKIKTSFKEAAGWFKQLLW